MAIRWEKLTVKTQQAIQEAQSRAAELSNPELQPVHLLLALIEDREGVVPAVLEKIGVPIEHLESDLRSIEQKLPRVAGVAAQPSLSQAMNKVLEQAFREATNFKDEYVSTEHLLLGVAHLKGDAARELRQILGVFFQRLELLFRILVGHALRAAHGSERLQNGLMRGARGHQRIACGIAFQMCHAKQ